MRLEHRSFKTPSNKVVELTTVASNYHIEMSPGDAGIYDRYVVQVRGIGHDFRAARLRGFCAHE